MALKVAIVGLAQDSRGLIPWRDPAWELWGLAWDADSLRMHRTFEPHDMADLARTYPNLAAYLDRIQHCPRLYMAEAYPQVAGVTRFPFEAVEADVGGYWCSSIAYAMSLAIHEKAEEIALHGVDMRGEDEYGYQRANMEYLIGFARGRGITVHVPEESALCKHASPHDRDYRGRYGRS